MLQNFRQGYTLAVVVLGDFNPSIFQPFWFSHKELIGEQEAKKANIRLIHRDLVQWEIGWMIIEVSKGRLEIKSTQEPYFDALKDLLISTFKILSETPVRQIGINHLQYFALPDQERYYEFGNKLVPLNKWKPFFQDPRMYRLEIGDIDRKDGFNGKYRVQILPSDVELTTKYGVLIFVNDHYDISQDFEKKNDEIERIFSENWTNSISKANEMCEFVGSIN